MTRAAKIAQRSPNAERQRRFRASRAATLQVPLDAPHAECVRYIVDESGETAAALVRRLLREEAARRGAPIE